MTSVRTRILLFFTLFAAVSLIAVFMGSRSTRNIGQASNEVVQQHLPMVHALGEMANTLSRQEGTVYRYLSSTNKMWLDEYEKYGVDFNRSFSEAESLTHEPIELDKFSEIDELYVQYDNQVRQALLTRRQDAQRAFRMAEAGDSYLMKIQELVNELKGIRQGMTIVRREQITGTLIRNKRVAFYFLVSIVIFFLILAFYLWRFLVQPLSLLLEAIRNFTRGKTDVVIPRIGKDELGELQEAFNEMSRELEVERKRLKSESQSDALTGLFNMRYFRIQLVDEFSRSQRYGRPLTLLMIDVDYFKAYNDRNGHPAGDIVLKEVARILIRNVRGTDIVARYGGEEFVVLLPETPMDAGISVAEKIRHAVETHYFPFAGSDTGDKLSVSIGVASYPDVHVTSDQDLVESSDKALYRAKKDGRNRVCYSDRESAPNSSTAASPKKAEVAKK